MIDKCNLQLSDVVYVYIKEDNKVCQGEVTSICVDTGIVELYTPQRYSSFYEGFWYETDIKNIFKTREEAEKLVKGGIYK